MEPLVTVVIPNFNRGKLMVQTLDSLLNQHFERWEAIVVDDGSTDQSVEVGQRYAALDARIRFTVRNTQPAGAPTCRNIGWQLARSPYVVFLDSDDLLAPHCLGTRVQWMQQHPECDFIVFPMLVFTQDISRAVNLWNMPTAEPDIERFIRLDAVWQTSGPIWKKAAVEKLGGFTEGMTCWQDVDFHLKALTAGLPYKHATTEPDAYYRRHESGSVSQAEISTLPKLKTRLQVFTTHSQSLIARYGLPSKLKEKLQLLGSNVVFGSLKVHQWAIAFSALRFGYGSGIFTVTYLLAAYTIALGYFLRVNKIGAINKKIDSYMARWRMPSAIGSIPYQKIQSA